jgi:hypothetical protein
MIKMSEEEAKEMLKECKDFACVNCNLNKGGMCPDEPSDEVCYIQYMKQSGIIRAEDKDDRVKKLI